VAIVTFLGTMLTLCSSNKAQKEAMDYQKQHIELLHQILNKSK
jgi:hypothetical protein